MKTLNLFSYRQCVNEDVATKTATYEQLKHICSGTKLSNEERWLVTFTDLLMLLYDHYFVELEMV